MLTSLTPFDADTILPLADARDQLRLTDSDTFHDDAVISARSAAIGWTEEYTGHSLQERQFYLTLERVSSLIRLPRVPVASVDGANYFATDGTDTEFVGTDWYLGNDALVSIGGAIYGTGLRMTFTAGYADAADIPPHLLAAVKLAMTAFFENRSNPDLSGAKDVADQFRAVL